MFYVVKQMKQLILNIAIILVVYDHDERGYFDMYEYCFLIWITTWKEYTNWKPSYIIFVENELKK